MTYQQEQLINKVTANLSESCDILDYLRYRMEEPLTKKDQAKLNECYEHICIACLIINFNYYE